MKILPFAALFIVIAPAAFGGSTVWQDFYVDDEVTLTQDLFLRGTDGTGIRVRPGRQYRLESIEPLSGISVIDYVFAARGCPRPEVEGDLTIVRPRENPPSSKAEVGVYYRRECALEILVETKDLAKPSFYRKESAHRGRRVR